jgi:hypothetical protein
MYTDAAEWITLDGDFVKKIGSRKLWKKRVRTQVNHFPNDGTLDIMVVKINPKTRRIDDDPKLNTETEVWLESGPWTRKEDKVPFGNEFWVGPSHDIRLDCGAPTLDRAVIKLARLVRRHYGLRGRKGRGSPNHKRE